jgi:short-subunit dehydrogenase
MLAMVRLNCEALMDLQARYSAGMVERGRGAILNVASTAAFQPMPGSATYAASKSFVLSLSEATFSEVKGKGVTVTALCPGPVKTEFMEVAGIDGAEEQLPDLFWSTPEGVAKAAIAGLEKGKRVVVPGVFNRATAMGGQHTPRALSLPLVKRVWGAAGSARR